MNLTGYGVTNHQRFMLVGGGYVDIHRSFLRSRDCFACCIYFHPLRLLHLMESSHHHTPAYPCDRLWALFRSFKIQLYHSHWLHRCTRHVRPIERARTTRSTIDPWHQIRQIRPRTGCDEVDFFDTTTSDLDTRSLATRVLQLPEVRRKDYT